MTGKWRLLFSGVVLLVFLLGLGSGLMLDGRAGAASPVTPSAQGSNQLDEPLIQQAWNLIQQHYVDRQAVNATQLTYGAVGGMVSALGDTGHSVFLSPDMVKQEQNYTQGYFEGIGAEVETKDGQIVIVTPLDGSPAQVAGVRPGDIIVKVNGADTTGQTLAQVVSSILGPAGTQVKLTLFDPKTNQTRDATITRQRIVVPPVNWQFVPGTKVAHVRVGEFSANVVTDLQQSLTEAQRQGATAVVLDLRNDPGGLLDGAVGVASQFLRSGDVLQEKNAQGKITTVPVKADGPKTDLPMVVLVNQGTASAAEIVAGALQDAGRAKVVGETTFGTGTVLNEFRLSDGSALMLAVEEWLTPKGRTIWHQGITPDVVVTLPANATPVFPEEEKSMTPEQFQASGDTQLQRALDVLIGAVHL
jgi:carboxyl-terminal processing protease